ncbi:hypothetical protein MKZ38_009029 [Zalerion maritima]|uniref:2EXR domain-containing protein n=1 Tax=Zalerion maritima TaxID=339359 RepID=A0AAD5WTP3_9PEZI|nr:hypothetical protein MKZ38_009029 [Zalerion maritima]
MSSAAKPAGGGSIGDTTNSSCLSSNVAQSGCPDPSESSATDRAELELLVDGIKSLGTSRKSNTSAQGGLPSAVKVSGDDASRLSLPELLIAKTVELNITRGGGAPETRGVGLSSSPSTTASSSSAALPKPVRGGVSLADSPPPLAFPYASAAVSGAVTAHSHLQSTTQVSTTSTVNTTPKLLSTSKPSTCPEPGGRAGVGTEGTNFTINPTTDGEMSSSSSSSSAAAAAAAAAAASSPARGAVPSLGTSPSTSPQPSPFHLFSSLPAELRHQIWRYTFTPRAIEIHALRRPHYAELGMAHWQTRCYPHPTLLACHESRLLALKHYRIHVWLGSGRLHLSPTTDIVVVLGQLDMARIQGLLNMFVQRDPVGIGLTRLGLNASCWEYTGVRGIMRSMSRTMFTVFEEFVLVLYMEPIPPEDWGFGVCELYGCEDECDNESSYMMFKKGKARELRDSDEDDWMVVGQNRMKVLGLNFINGWGQRDNGTVSGA